MKQDGKLSLSRFLLKLFIKSNRTITNLAYKLNEQND